MEPTRKKQRRSNSSKGKGSEAAAGNSTYFLVKVPKKLKDELESMVDPKGATEVGRLFMDPEDPQYVHLKLTKGYHSVVTEIKLAKQPEENTMLLYKEAMAKREVGAPFSSFTKPLQPEGVVSALYTATYADIGTQQKKKNARKGLAKLKPRAFGEQEIMSDQRKAYHKKQRQIKSAIAQRRYEAITTSQLKNLVCNSFSDAENGRLSLDELKEKIRQPVTTLKAVLEEVCDFDMTTRRYELKPGYRLSDSASSVSSIKKDPGMQ